MRTKIFVLAGFVLLLILLSLPSSMVSAPTAVPADTGVATTPTSTPFEPTRFTCWKQGNLVVDMTTENRAVVAIVDETKVWKWDAFDGPHTYEKTADLACMQDGNSESRIQKPGSNPKPTHFVCSQNGEQIVDTMTADGAVFNMNISEGEFFTQGWTWYSQSGHPKYLAVGQYFGEETVCTQE